MLTLILSVMCASCFGFAAQRSSICVISGLLKVIEDGSTRLILSFFRCSLWVALISVPLASLSFDVNPAEVYAPSLIVIGGGIAFGIGATINGGCAFGTLTRLATGDMSFLSSVAGIAAGVELQHGASWIFSTSPPIGPSVVTSSPGWGLALFALALVHGAQELVVRFRGPFSGRWPPEKAVAVMGLCAGLLYALNGPWNYLLDPDRLIAIANSQQIDKPSLAILSIATLAGGVVCAVNDREFRLRLPLSVLPRRALGGTLMGMGSAVIPGGNSVLILHAYPLLSPHATPAYAAMIMSSGAMLYLSSVLRHSARFPFRNRGT
jgi:uncharacterized membrane protein YedE/YeeE